MEDIIDKDLELSLKNANKCLKRIILWNVILYGVHVARQGCVGKLFYETFIDGDRETHFMQINVEERTELQIL